MQLLPEVIVQGIPTIERAIVNKTKSGYAAIFFTWSIIILLEIDKGFKVSTHEALSQLPHTSIVIYRSNEWPPAPDTHCVAFEIIAIWTIEQISHSINSIDLPV